MLSIVLIILFLTKVTRMWRKVCFVELGGSVDGVADYFSSNLGLITLGMKKGNQKLGHLKRTEHFFALMRWFKGI